MTIINPILSAIFFPHLIDKGTKIKLAAIALLAKTAKDVMYTDPTE